MNQTCCLNPECCNPTVVLETKFCPDCGSPIVVLRDHYRPIKPLGSGGFGKTYLAEDRDRLNEPCVIKQFAPLTQSPRALKYAKQLFKQEAIRLQELNHPQIPRLQAYFDEDNYLYLIQDFIEGQDLTVEICQKGTFDNQKIRELLYSLLPVLETIHQKNIIHRDIKPDNIMRRQDGVIFLIDFGASRQLEGTMRPGTVIGSFGYMPLEQIKNREIYPASDLFSLGVSCFYLMTGIYPSDLWSDQGFAWVKDWQNHLSKPIDPSLKSIIDKLLALDYHHRYQSAGAVLQDLRLKPPNPEPEPPNPEPEPPNPPKGRPRSKFILVAGIAGGGVALAIAGHHLLRNPSPALTEDASLADSPSSLISEDLAQSTPVASVEDTSEPVEPEKTPSPSSAPPPPSPLEDDLTSAIGFSYVKLRDLLAGEQWQQANDETIRIMLIISGKAVTGVLDEISINNLPCQDLRTINALWLKYSNGRFGFSVQKRIYQSLGGTSEYQRSIAETFGDRLGWREGDTWKTYSQLTFNPSAPEGHLPSDLSSGGFRWGFKRGVLFERMTSCGI